MKKFKLFLYINLFLFLISCGTVREGFQNPKKNNTDEFLVEKKNPLVLPPDYDKLPMPIDKKNIQGDDNIDLNSSLGKIKDNSNNSNNGIEDSSLEEKILKKIK